MNLLWGSNIPTLFCNMFSPEKGLSPNLAHLVQPWKSAVHYMLMICFNKFGACSFFLHVSILAFSLHFWLLLGSFCCFAIVGFFLTAQQNLEVCNLLNVLDFSFFVFIVNIDISVMILTSNKRNIWTSFIRRVLHFQD